MPTTQLGISLKPTCLVILLVLNGKEWPELNGEKREPTTGKWAKGLTRVTNKKRTVMAKSALRGRASRFFIPQTVTQTAAGAQALPADCHKLTTVRVGQGAKAETSYLLTAGENFPAYPCGDGRAPYRKVGEHLLHDSTDAISRGEVFSSSAPTLRLAYRNPWENV